MIGMFFNPSVRPHGAGNVDRRLSDASSWHMLCRFARTMNESGRHPMSIANPRPQGLSPSPASVDHTSLYKDDRPRRIDQTISFFGDGDSAIADTCGEELLEQ